MILKCFFALCGFLALVSHSFAFESLLPPLPAKDAPITHTVVVGIDNQMRKGQSDVNGDAKAVEHFMRKGFWVLGWRGALESPQAMRASQMRDTAQGKLTLGVETPRTSLYATLGTTQNGVPQFAYRLVDGLHQISGMGGKARRSPLSAAPSLIAGLDMRADFAFEKEACLGLCLGAHLASFATLNTLETSVGAGAYLAVQYNKAKGETGFKPHLQGLPAQEVRQTALYTGLRAKYMGHDALFMPNTLRPLRLEAVAGATIKSGSLKGEGFGFGVDYSAALLPELRNVSSRPVHKIMMRTSFTF
jgi:hypothetical protein